MTPPDLTKQFNGIKRKITKKEIREGLILFLTKYKRENY